jgi:4-deoxy-L-threo-5-hexosulose-uronate ketol-isomerase
MEFKHTAHPRDVKNYDTDRLREEYHVPSVFEPGKVKTVYTYEDRMIIGGACPQEELPLDCEQEIGVEYFLERREMGAINIGGRGSIEVDGNEYTLDTYDGMYVGLGSKAVTFKSADPDRIAKFYFNSTPAHKNYPTTKIEFKKLKQGNYGSLETSSKRRIYQHISPSNLETCQLVMGLTMLEQNNVWNTMPCHLHDRRMEAYFYFNLPEDALVFHFMGEPNETRHIVVRNEEAVISPSWSIHSGAGTHSYCFIWGMGGENRTVTDVKAQSMDYIK